MDIVTTELIVFCVITIYTGVTLSTEFIEECNTTLTFTKYDTSLILAYDGAVLTDLSGKPCTAMVEIKHISNTTISICLKLHSEYDTCRKSLIFFYAENPKGFYNCDRIQHRAKCRQSNTVFLEFLPWTNITVRDIRISVYEQAYEPGESNVALYVGIAAIFVVVIIVVAIVIAIVMRQRNARNERLQTGKQPTLTRYQSQKRPGISDDLPAYPDPIPSTNRENSANSTVGWEPFDTTTRAEHLDTTTGGEPLDTTTRSEPMSPSAPPMNADVIA